MKKVKISLLCLTSLFLFTSESLNLSAQSESIVEIKDENNLATWKYDWDVVGIGAGKTSFDSGNLRMENINSASSNYALYKTNKFNEFRLDMYANLYLPCPSDINAEAQNDYANLYLTTFIDYEDASIIENVAMSACPWTNNKGWFSICFERISGQSHIQMLVNEAFDGNGAARYYLKNDSNGGSVLANIDWCDNQYHLFTIEAISTHAKDSSRPRYDNIGITYRVSIDGVLQTEYFLADAYYSNTNKKDEIIPFDTQKGYIGFWASSGYGASATTENTNVAVDISKLQITSYDDVENKNEALPYTKCNRPDFKLNSITNYAPAASYEVNEELEIKLSELFEYDGDKKLTYSAVCNGNEIGTIRNGYFVWEPTETGIYTISFTASDGELSANNIVRFRVEESETTNNNNSNNTSQPTDNNSNASGCNSSVNALFYLSFAFFSIIVLLKNKVNRF